MSDTGGYVTEMESLCPTCGARPGIVEFEGECRVCAKLRVNQIEKEDGALPPFEIFICPAGKGDFCWRVNYGSTSTKGTNRSYDAACNSAKSWIRSKYGVRI